MQCGGCKREWSFPPELEQEVRFCPFCGRQIERKKRALNSLEDVIREIFAQLGPEGMREDERLLNYFRDLAPGMSRESRLLEVLIRAGGHITLLEAREQKSGEQQTCMERTTLLLKEEYFLEEKAARQICSAFLRGVGAQLPPEKKTREGGRTAGGTGTAAAGRDARAAEKSGGTASAVSAGNGTGGAAKKAGAGTSSTAGTAKKAATAATAQAAAKGKGPGKPGHLFAVGSAIYFVGDDGSVRMLKAEMGGHSGVENWTQIQALAGDSQMIFGLKKDGSLVYWMKSSLERTEAGKALLEARNWTDLQALAAGKGYLVGLKRDGALRRAGNSGLKTTDASWEAIKAISVGGNHSAALKRNGDVLVAQEDGATWCNPVKKWEDIVAIASGSERLLGLRWDGVLLVVETGSGGRLDVKDWHGIRQISAFEQNVIAMDYEGRCYSNVKGISQTWTGMTEVLAARDCVLARDQDGVFHCSDPVIEKRCNLLMSR